MKPSKRARDPAAPLLKMRSSSRIRKESKQVRGLATPLLQWRPISRIMECKRKGLVGYKVPLTEEETEEEVVGYKVPLTKEEEDSWADFKNYDERKHELANLKYPGRSFKEMQLIDDGQPMVLFFAKFAVDTFNKICSKFGVDRGLRLIKTLTTKYRIAIWKYVINMDLLVLENGKILQYEAIVVADYSSGIKTLCQESGKLKKRGEMPCGALFLPRPTKTKCRIGANSPSRKKGLTKKSRTKTYLIEIPFIREKAKPGPTGNEAELGHNVEVPGDCGLGKSCQNRGGYCYDIPLKEFDIMNFPF